MVNRTYNLHIGSSLNERLNSPTVLELVSSNMPKVPIKSTIPPTQQTVERAKFASVADPYLHCMPVKNIPPKHPNIIIVIIPSFSTCLRNIHLALTTYFHWNINSIPPNKSKNKIGINNITFQLFKYKLFTYIDYKIRDISFPYTYSLTGVLIPFTVGYYNRGDRYILIQE